MSTGPLRSSSKGGGCSRTPQKGGVRKANSGERSSKVLPLGKTKQNKTKTFRSPGAVNLPRPGTELRGKGKKRPFPSPSPQVGFADSQGLLTSFICLSTTDQHP